jgi:hypothetical protein
MPGTRPGMTSRSTRGRERSRPFFVIASEAIHCCGPMDCFVASLLATADGFFLPRSFQHFCLRVVIVREGGRSSTPWLLDSIADARDCWMPASAGMTGSAIPSSSFRGAPSASPESITTIVSMDSGPAPSGPSTMCNCTSGNDGGESLPTVSRPALSYLAPLAGRGRIASQMRSG